MPFDWSSSPQFESFCQYCNQPNAASQPVFTAVCVYSLKWPFNWVGRVVTPITPGHSNRTLVQIVCTDNRETKRYWLYVYYGNTRLTWSFNKNHTFGLWLNWIVIVACNWPYLWLWLCCVSWRLLVDCFLRLGKNLFNKAMALPPRSHQPL